MKPTSVLAPGDVAGEGELLFAEAQHAASLVAITELRVMEVSYREIWGRCRGDVGELRVMEVELHDCNTRLEP